MTAGSSRARYISLLWLRGHIFEAAAFLVGAGLRVRMHWSFNPDWGYDSESHLGYVSYVARNHTLPGIAEFQTAYHPPLFYVMGALGLSAGLDPTGLQWISIAMGIVRLAVLWWALFRYVPDRLARPVALALAAVLPCAVHGDAMVSNEPLNCLLSTIAIALIPGVFHAESKARRWRALGLGATLLAALLAKISALVIVGVVAMGSGLEALLSKRSLRHRAAHALPLLAACAIALSIAALVHDRNHVGHVFPTSFDGYPKAQVFAKSVETVPYWKRRPLAYVLGTGGDVLATPYFPTDAKPASRFWPVLLATTFADYYNYRFAGEPSPGVPTMMVNTRPLALRTISMMRASVAAGLVIGIATVVALVLAALSLLRQRDMGLLVVVVVPVAAVLGALHFSVKFPFDDEGMVKGTYLQFAAGPLFALFGVAVSWLWQRPALRVFAVGEMCALAIVSAYTVHCLF